MENKQYDPIEAAMNPQVREGNGRWFGQCFIDVWACVLQKGAGKVPFIPGQHEDKDRLTAIKMEVIPLPEHNVQFTVLREMIAEFGAWPKQTLPSIRAIGADLRGLDKAWVSIELKPSGRTYTDKHGETKEEKAIVILAVFGSEAACREAYNLYNAGAEPVAAAPAAANGKEKETAAMFLKPLWLQAAGDTDKMTQLLASNPLTSKYFTIQSPEVQTAMA